MGLPSIIENWYTDLTVEEDSNDVEDIFGDGLAGSLLNFVVEAIYDSYVETYDDMRSIWTNKDSSLSNKLFETAIEVGTTTLRGPKNAIDNLFHNEPTHTEEPMNFYNQFYTIDQTHEPDINGIDPQAYVLPFPNDNGNGDKRTNEGSGYYSVNDDHSKNTWNDWSISFAPDIDANLAFDNSQDVNNSYVIDQTYDYSVNYGSNNIINSIVDSFNTIYTGGLKFNPNTLYRPIGSNHFDPTRMVY